MTRLYALLIIIAFIFAGAVWFVSELGGESYWQVLKDALVMLRHILILFLVVGSVAYVLDVLITGSWSWR